MPESWDDAPVAIDRDESEAQRLDRNWSELLQELRVTQTGVQILAGFLLTLPFQQRFTHLGTAQRVLFLVALVLSIVATGLIVAPVSSHRLLFRRHEKEVLVDAANLLAKAGLGALALTVVTVLVLMFSVVVGPTASVVAGVASLVFFLVCWVGIPIALARRHRQRTQREGTEGLR